MAIFSGRVARRSLAARFTSAPVMGSRHGWSWEYAARAGTRSAFYSARSPRAPGRLQESRAALDPPSESRFGAVLLLQHGYPFGFPLRKVGPRDIELFAGACELGIAVVADLAHRGTVRDWQRGGSRDQAGERKKAKLNAALRATVTVRPSECEPAGRGTQRGREDVL